MTPPERLSAAHRAVFQAARRAVMAQDGGVWLAGDAGTGKTTLLGDVLADLPAPWIVLRHGADALGPKELAEQLNAAVQAVAGRTDPSGVVLAIDDADRLRRDTLDALDGMAGWLFGRERRVQLVLASRPTLGARLTANRHDQLASCLTSRFLLPPLAAEEAAAFLQGVLETRRLSLPVRTRRAILAEAGGRPGQINTQVEQAVHRLAERPRRVARRAAAIAVPGGLALAAAVAGIWYARVPPPALPPIEAAAASPSPLVPAAVPVVLAAVGPPVAEPVRPVAATLAVALAPIGVAEPDPAVLGAPPRPVGLLAASDPLGPAQPLLLAGSVVASATQPDPEVIAGTTMDSPSTPAPRPAPGLLLVAQPGDTLAQLYQEVYRGTVAPAFRDVQAANPGPVRPGRRMLFPSPPHGWISN